MNIIEQANEYFKNVFLNEMAFSRDDALKKMKSLSEPIFEHIMKCVVYEDTTGNLDHWKEEIATYLDIINDLDLKTKTGRLKQKDYLEQVFYREAENETDVKANLKLFNLNKNYPDFKITPELISKVFTAYKIISENCSEIFADKFNTFEKLDFKMLVMDALEQVGIY